MAPNVLLENFLRQCEDHGWLAKRISPIRSNPFNTYKLRLKVDDVEATFSTVEIEKYPLPSDVALSVAKANNANFVLAPKIGRSLGSDLRRLRINHADLSGRISMRSPGLVVEMDRQPNYGDSFKTWLNEHDRTNTIDLSSPKTAQLVFCLLAWPRLLTAPTRLIAEVGGVSLGMVPRTIRYLEESRMVYDRQWVGSGRSQTAQTWLAAYRSKLSPSLSLERMEGPFGMDLNIVDALLGGGSAVPELIRTRTATIYIRSLKSEFLRANRLRRSPTPNIELRKQFWTPPPEEFLDEPQRLPASASLSYKPAAPALLVYADLMSSNDPREQETASVFLREEPRLQWLRPVTL